jgi:glycosyltransferase involved in cell wall biosynthesis
MDFCVLIPCFNNPEGLKASLASISYHPHRCCVLVVDDGSKNPVQVSPEDCPVPVHVLRLELNAGIVQALNTGLDWITRHMKPRYIARLDCADLCHPERFHLQVQYLDQHSGTGLVGSWCRFEQPGTDLSYSYTTPTEHREIIRALHFRNVFIHPAVMFRTELLDKVGKYPHAYPHCEDYALFWKMAQVTGTAILPEVLVTCEINPGGLSMRNRKAQLRSRYRIVAEFGSIPQLRLAGLAKLSLMRLIPYKLILKTKQKVVI